MKTAVKISKLNFVYPDGTLALKDINLAIGEGESVAIVGHNGAGKSTLLLHLNGLLRGKGEIEIKGVSINHQNLKLIRQVVGLVFQDPEDQLFMPTVFDDVAFGPLNMGFSKSKIQQRVKEALRKVGMNGFEKRLSHHLSFGEKKLIAIATVLAMEPEILVIDEPTANLDPRSRRQLMSILKDLPQTKVIATHDMDFAYKTTERTIILYRSQIVVDGKTTNVLTQEKLLLKYDLELPASVAASHR